MKYYLYLLLGGLIFTNAAMGFWIRKVMFRPSINKRMSIDLHRDMTYQDLLNQIGRLEIEPGRFGSIATRDCGSIYFNDLLFDQQLSEYHFQCLARSMVTYVFELDDMEVDYVRDFRK